MTVPAPAIKPSLVLSALLVLNYPLKHRKKITIAVAKSLLLTFPNTSNLPKPNTKSTIQSCTENHDHIGLHT